MSTLEKVIEKLHEDEKKIAFWLLWELHGILMWWESEVCPRELAIYNSIPSKISRSSFTAHCDKNNISEKLARNYWLVRLWWWWIDQIAQSANFMFWDWEGNYVDVNDVVEFMNSDYRWWKREFIRINLTAKIRPVVEQLNNLWITYNYTNKHKKIISWILNSRIIVDYKNQNNDTIPF